MLAFPLPPSLARAGIKRARSPLTGPAYTGENLLSRREGRMRVKAGVNLDGVHFMLFFAAAYYDYMRQANGLGEGTITSGKDGGDSYGPARVHSSFHPSGRAVDLRTRDMPVEVANSLALALQEALGSDFRIVLEQDHIHVELRSTRSFT